MYSIMDDTPKVPSKFKKTAAPSDSCRIQAIPVGVVEARHAEGRGCRGGRLTVTGNRSMGLTSAFPSRVPVGAILDIFMCHKRLPCAIEVP